MRCVISSDPFGVDHSASVPDPYRSQRRRMLTDARVMSAGQVPQTSGKLLHESRGWLHHDRMRKWNSCFARVSGESTEKFFRNFSPHGLAPVSEIFSQVVDLPTRPRIGSLPRTRARRQLARYQQRLHTNNTLLAISWSRSGQCLSIIEITIPAQAARRMVRHGDWLPSHAQTRIAHCRWPQ